MTVREMREKYLRFFESKGHSRFPSGSLIPVDVTGRLDESLLFNGAGMVQFKPYFRGIAEPPNRRLATAQKCVRTGDIETVGDLSHLTFFEMMGNFSFGDYFKADAIGYSWEFITSPEWLGLDPKRVAFTVFEADDEAYAEWAKHVASAGIRPETRVFRLGEETNYWPAGAFSAGPPGPCGPNTEMFYWTSNDEPFPTGAYGAEDFVRDEAAGKWLEFWNDVFIQFEWQGHLKNPERPDEGWVKDGMPPLPFQSVDTGMGVERACTVINGRKDLYLCDSFAPILKKLEEVALGGSRFVGSSSGTEGADEAAPSHRNLKYGANAETDRAMRIIADHIRTAVFCIADGVLPGNAGRGYVLRRLIRRAVLKGQRVLGFEKPFFYLAYEGVAEAMADHYTELIERRDVIVETLKNEEALFRATLAKGLARLEEWLLEPAENGIYLYALGLRRKQLTSGIPTELIDVVAGVDESAVLGTLPLIAGSETGFHREYAKARQSNRLGYLVSKTIGHLHVLSSDGDLVEANRLLEKVKLEGEQAFMLYDTFGFPIEVTRELCQEWGIELDIGGFEDAMQRAQERSRASGGMDTVYGNVSIKIEFKTVDGGKPTPTRFLGYETTSADATITGVLPETDDKGRLTGNLVIALDQTPFYAESGGQISDEGRVVGDGFEFKVIDLIKQDGVFVHLVRTVSPGEDEAGGKRSVASASKGKQEFASPTSVKSSGLPDIRGLDPTAATEVLNKNLFGKPVKASVDVSRRKEIQRNHTATHLLHAALREVLGSHVTQAGSYVGPDRLRFDFTHGKALSQEELERVERVVNEQALENTPVTTHADLPIAEAKKRGAMALFGEKYGDKVRMVEIGGFSRELCGGTHVRSTGEIGLFKIVSEASAASGVRRIEALTGSGAFEWVTQETARVREAASLLKANPTELAHAVASLQEQLREERRKREKAEAALVKGGPRGDAPEAEGFELVGAYVFWSPRFHDLDSKIVAASVDEKAEGKPNLVALATVLSEGKVQFICRVGPEAQKAGVHAGNLVREVAQIAGGGGGGRPDFATAGGKLPEKVDEAIQKAREIVRKAGGLA